MTPRIHLNVSTTRHCLCGTRREGTQPVTVRAESVAARCAELGLPVTVPQSQVTDPALARDLAMMDTVGLCRRCGWARTGGRLAQGGGRWAS